MPLKTSLTYAIVGDGTAAGGTVLYWQDPDWPCYEEELRDPSAGMHWGPLQDIYEEQDGSFSVGIEQQNTPIGPRILGRLPAKDTYLNPDNLN